MARENKKRKGLADLGSNDALTAFLNQPTSPKPKVSSFGNVSQPVGRRRTDPTVVNGKNTPIPFSQPAKKPAIFGGSTLRDPSVKSAQKITEQRNTETARVKTPTEKRDELVRKGAEKPVPKRAKANKLPEFVYDSESGEIGVNNKDGDFVPIPGVRQKFENFGDKPTKKQFDTIDAVGGAAFKNMSKAQRKNLFTSAPAKPTGSAPALGDTSAFRNQLMQDIQNDQQSVLGNIGDPTITARIARNMAMLNALQPAQTTAKDFVTFNRGEAFAPGGSEVTRNLGEGVLDIRTGRPVQGLGGQQATRQAPQAAIDLLIAQPELAPQFQAQFGYLPN